MGPGAVTEHALDRGFGSVFGCFVGEKFECRGRGRINGSHDGDASRLRLRGPSDRLRCHRPIDPDDLGVFCTGRAFCSARDGRTRAHDHVDSGEFAERGLQLTPQMLVDAIDSGIFEEFGPHEMVRGELGCAGPVACLLVDQAGEGVDVHVGGMKKPDTSHIEPYSGGLQAFWEFFCDRVPCGTDPMRVPFMAIAIIPRLDSQPRPECGRVNPTPDGKPEDDLDAVAFDAPLDFDTYYRDDYRQLVGLAFVLTGSRSLAEDVCQDALTEAHRRWDTIGSYDDPGAWVRRVMVNKSRSRFRKLTSETKALTRIGARRLETVEPTERSLEVWDRVRELPRRQSQAIALFYWEDRSMAQIAEILECSEETVKTHLKRGRKALAETLGSAWTKDADDE